jgi:hypothetical protein
MSLPKITAQSLVRYMETQRPAQRADLLRKQQSGLGKKHFAPYYQQSFVAIRAFHGGDADALDETFEKLQRLLREANVRLRGAGREERSKILNEVAKLANNARVCNDYREHFGDRQLDHRLRRYTPLNVSGVRVSGEATLLGELTQGKRSLSCAVIVDPHDEAPSDESVAYQLELLHALAGGEKAELPPRGFQIWHPSTGRIWQMKRPSIMRWRDVESACIEIASVWDRL